MWHSSHNNDNRQLNMHDQHGAAFIVMLVIMIMGVTIVLVSALSKVSLQTARNNKSSELLAQAKEVVIGYAVNGTGGSQRPGDIMRPDSLSASESPPNYDGASEMGCLDVTQSNTPPFLLTTNVTNIRCLGRLPWKNYGLSIESPSENDSTGFMPWYAVSSNLMDPDTVNVKLNSELLNDPPPHPWLTVRDMNGNVLSSRVVFVIIIPGAPLTTQSRPASPNLGGANQYLDSITVPAGCTAPCVPGTYSNSDLDDSFIIGDEHRWIDDPSNPGKQIEDSSYNFNDKLLYVTIDELMPLIEKRLAREVKSCLDNYAAGSANKYPWAAPISDITTYASSNGTRFGRIPALPTVNTTQFLNSGNTNDSNIQALFNAMSALGTAVQNCIDTGSSQTALAAAGAQLVIAANAVATNQPTVPPIDSIPTNYAITAGNKAQSNLTPTRCNGIESGSSTTVQSNLANAYSTLGATPVTVPEDATMQIAWTAGCFDSGNMSNYWGDWQRLVLYQVSDNYRPRPPAGSIVACGGTTTCLSISGSGNPNTGSGNYRAAIIMAGKKIGAQTRGSQTASEYLELNNQTNKTNAPSNLTFDTYKLSDSNYSTVNDIVLCLDGKNNCQ